MKVAIIIALFVICQQASAVYITTEMINPFLENSRYERNELSYKAKYVEDDDYAIDYLIEHVEKLLDDREYAMWCVEELMMHAWDHYRSAEERLARLIDNVAALQAKTAYINTVNDAVYQEHILLYLVEQLLN